MTDVTIDYEPKYNKHLIKKGMVGRKMKYDESFLARVLKLAKKGLSDREISEQLRISKMTFYEYRNKYPEFADALKRNG